MSKIAAIIGASSDRRKFGNKSVRAHLKAGYQVVAIHPTETEVEGVPVYRSIAEVPGDRVDRVSIYVPPQVALGVLDSLTSKPVGEVWLNPGVDTNDVIAKANQLGLNVIAGCSIVDLGLSPSQFP